VCVNIRDIYTIFPPPSLRSNKIICVKFLCEYNGKEKLFKLFKWLSLTHSPFSLSLSLSLTHARTHAHTHTQEEFGRKYPRLMKPMLHERDMFLAYVLRIQGP
jgi:hypothetical protein